MRARCSLCRLARHYLPGDLIYLAGNVGASILERKMRCEQCGKRDYMTVEFWLPTGQEWVGLTVRRLVGTRMVRKVYWRDEPARG